MEKDLKKISAVLGVLSVLSSTYGFTPVIAVEQENNVVTKDVAYTMYAVPALKHVSGDKEGIGFPKLQDETEPTDMEKLQNKKQIFPMAKFAPPMPTQYTHEIVPSAGVIEAPKQNVEEKVKTPEKKEEVVETTENKEVVEADNKKEASETAEITETKTESQEKLNQKVEEETTENIEEEASIDGDEIRPDVIFHEEE